RPPLALPPFPTRRSSDLQRGRSHELRCHPTSHRNLSHGRLLPKRCSAHPNTVSAAFRPAAPVSIPPSNHGIGWAAPLQGCLHPVDRKSTRLNSSHRTISY